MAMPYRVARKVRLEVETLEDRRLLASHISLAPPSGVVTVIGSSSSDNILVSYHASKVRVALTGGVDQTAQFARRRVKEVVIIPNGGYDSWYNTTRVPVFTVTGPTPPTASSIPTASSVPLTSVAFKSTAPDPATADQTLLQQVNAYRQGAGLRPLAADPRLMQVAQAHANNMARQDKYGDTDTNGHILDGHDVVYRVAQVGYRWSSLGENVAYDFGYYDPAGQLMIQWWNSLEHRANILGTKYTVVGIGVATGASGRTYGVMVFATPA
jgi:uncharacterized protein YkwD